MACNIGWGDEVIVPDFTMAACGFAVSYTGADVVTVDCGLDLCIDVDQIERKITRRTKAIMAVHIYGRLCDMKRIREIADRHNLIVIEDACEAQGAVKQSLADITCYSFFKNKIIHGEEGGMCTTDNKYYADRMNYLKNMTFDPSHSYYHNEIGFNYRMPDSQAKMILKSLKDYPKNNKRRWAIKGWYDELLKQNKELSAVWVYPIFSTNPLKIVQTISGARFYFKPLSSMPMWKQETGENAFINSLFGCYLPVSETMRRKDVEEIVRKLDELSVPHHTPSA
jgi:perosamine synthetase